MTNTTDELEKENLSNIVADKINPLPRSIVRRTAFELLDGEWRFTLDTENRGLNDYWFARHNYTETASFPGSFESHLAAAKDDKQTHSLYSNSDEAIAWYERDFSIPEGWQQDAD